MQVLTGATLIDGTGRIPVSDVAVVLNDADASRTSAFVLPSPFRPVPPPTT